MGPVSFMYPCNYCGRVMAVTPAPGMNAPCEVICPDCQQPASINCKVIDKNTVVKDRKPEVDYAKEADTILGMMKICVAMRIPIPADWIDRLNRGL